MFLQKNKKITFFEISSLGLRIWSQKMVKKLRIGILVIQPEKYYFYHFFLKVFIFVIFNIILLYIAIFISTSCIFL